LECRPCCHRALRLQRFENVHRLSLPGFLVLFPENSAGQLVTAMVINSTSIQVIGQFEPYLKVDENALSKLSLTSIFFTLLAAMMIKLQGAMTNDSQSAAFGILLIFVNTLGLFVVGLGVAFNPFVMAIRALQDKHIHNAEIKGMENGESLKEYFLRLAESDEEDACWEQIKTKTFRKVKEGAADVGILEDTVKGEVRCCTGDGPID